MADINSDQAVAAFIVGVLSVDESDDNALLAMINRHCPFCDRDEVTDDDREIIRGMRQMVSRLYGSLGTKDDVRERADLRTAVRAWVKANAVPRRENNIRGKRVALVALMTRARDGEFSKLVRTVANVTGSEMDRIMSELVQIDGRLWQKTGRGRELVCQLVLAMRRKRNPISPRLAAAKFSRAAGLFGDDTRLDARVVRSAYDTACGHSESP